MREERESYQKSCGNQIIFKKRKPAKMKPDFSAVQYTIYNTIVGYS